MPATQGERLNLTDFFLELALSYDRQEGFDSPAQKMIAESPSLLKDHVPAGMFALGGGGKGRTTYTPWVGLFNPDETDSPQRGLYVVYILSEDMEMLALTLHQGMEQLRKQYGDAEARLRLASDAAAIRRTLQGSHPGLPADPIDLRSKGKRQAAYEAGNVCCRMYALGALPPEGAMRADLRQMLDLYDDAIAVRRALTLAAPGFIASPSITNTTVGDDPLLNFRPKDDSDYLANLVGRQLVKTRRHERLVAEYAKDRATHGFDALTRHPRDLELVHPPTGQTFLIEAKVVYRGNATEAVRAAVGQLLTYSHFLYDGTKPHLVALFSEPVGSAYAAFLHEHGIAAVWWEDGEWRGSSLAQQQQLI